jgi:hypothetical protein
MNCDSEELKMPSAEDKFLAEKSLHLPEGNDLATVPLGQELVSI